MKRKLTNNMLLKILSVIAAIMLWLTVINIDDPDKTTTIRGIAITIVNDNEITDNNQVYEIIAGKTADITVTGPRSVVDALTANDFVATADFLEISQTNAIPIKVKVGEEKAEYESRLNITQITSTMRVDIEQIISKDFEIEVEYSGKTPNNYLLKEPTLSDKTVTVTAPESVVASIEKIKAVVNVTDLKTDLNTNVGLTLYSTSGSVLKTDGLNLKMSLTRVDVTAKMLVIKEVPIVYELLGDGALNSLITGHSIDKAKIKIIGREEDVAKVDKITIPKEMLDVTDLTESKDFIIDVEDILPNKTYICTGYETVKVSVVVEDIVDRLFTIDAREISIKKIPEGFEASIASEGVITIKLRGKKSILDAFDVNSLNPIVDLTNAVEGENEIALTVSLSNELTQVGDVTIIVDLNTKEAEDDTEAGAGVGDGTNVGEEAREVINVDEPTIEKES